jgi:hypothetical protein
MYVQPTPRIGVAIGDLILDLQAVLPLFSPALHAALSQVPAPFPFAESASGISLNTASRSTL